MPSTTIPVLERYRSMVNQLGAAAVTAGELRALSEAELLELNRLQTAATRLVGATGAAVAGELAYRSRPELGGEGLARRSGYRTVENLLKTTTGAPKEQVVSVVNAGMLLAEIADEGNVDPVTGGVRHPSQPWLRVVAEGVAAGRVSVAASQSIGRGLGTPNSVITAGQLEAAAVELVGQAVAGVDADRLWRNARDLRDDLDVAGVQVREDEVRGLRGLTHHPLTIGGGEAYWRMDDETYATFVDFYDRVTSPKRGGVRFVDPGKVEKARRIADDTRNYKQLASDALLHFLMVGADADPGIMLGSGAPIIRVTVAEEALVSGVGVGRIDGQAAPISIGTVKRLMENGKTLRVGFDPTGTYLEMHDDPLAENRLYNSKQREILAAKFGGCMDPDCDRSPSWCEAHHIQFVKRDGGKTTIANAILLCKYHHLLYHNRGYEIALDDNGTYWKIPPKTIDPEQTPTPMPLKTRNLNDLWAARARSSASAAS